nr:hypothetical protein [Tanacetum cinerariifolium]
MTIRDKYVGDYKYIIKGRIEAVDSDGHLRSYPSGLGGGSRAREGNGYKIWYSGSSSTRNGVGFVVVRRLKDDGVRVTRRSDRIMTISVVIDGEAINVISVYAPRVRLRGNLNGDIRSATDGYEGVHGGIGFGERNEEGRSILDFATAHDMVLANTFFKKTEAHLITFQCRGYYTQINYLLVCRGNLKACRDCRAFPGETCSSRHRLKNLKAEAVETFRATVSEKLSALEEDMSARNADQMWNILASIIRDVAKDSLGVASESAITHSMHRESWWFCEEVETKIAKARERKIMDIGNVRYIKDEGGRTIVREENIRKTRGEYFSSIFNDSPPIESRPKKIGDVESSRHQMHYDYYHLRINQGEVNVALQRIGRNKAVGPDQIPIEA